MKIRRLAHMTLLGLGLFFLFSLLSTGGCGWELPPIPFPTPPAPTPTPSPAPTPTPEPTPTPTPAPEPTPCPPDTIPRLVDGVIVGCDPKPVDSVFPVRFPKPGVRIYTKNKRYGNGVDSTLRIAGDPELGFLLHHVATSDYHTDSDVWQDGIFAGRPRGRDEMRALWEMYVYGGARDGETQIERPLGPVWQYQAGAEYGRCHNDERTTNTSCDHFGSAGGGRDDPKTPAFEGTPVELGDQRDVFGPYAGFFMVPQTSGKNFGTKVRACPPLAEGNKDDCGDWTSVNWK